jgi:mannose-6-phosphate isomerase
MSMDGVLRYAPDMGMEAPNSGVVRPQPLVFEPRVLEKVWGGRRLELLGKPLAKPGAGYGESWEIADLGATSASGAGGGAMRSVVATGPMAGRGIGEAMEAVGGPRPFPLLIKYLDAAENLSVQVHPSEAAARRDAGAHLKTESWYVVEAEAGASLYVGLRPGVRRKEFEAAVRRAWAVGEAARHPVVEMMERIEARPGMCLTLPSGIVHALGAGVMVAEVQTPSDTTYRLFDWGRAGRELHIEAGLASAFGDDGKATVERAVSAGPIGEGELCLRLAETRYYTIDEVRLLDGDEATVGFPCRFGGKRSGGGVKSPPAERGFVLMVIGGKGELAEVEGGFGSVALVKGATVYVPPGCAKGAVLRGGEGLRVLRVGVLGGAEEP